MKNTGVLLLMFLVCAGCSKSLERQPAEATSSAPVQVQESSEQIEGNAELSSSSNPVSAAPVESSELPGAAATPAESEDAAQARNRALVEALRREHEAQAAIQQHSSMQQQNHGTPKIGSPTRGGRPAIVAPAPPPAPIESRTMEKPVDPDDPPAARPLYWNAWVEPPCALFTRINPFANCPVGTAIRAKENTLVVSISLEALVSQISVAAPGALTRMLDDAGAGKIKLAIIPVLTDGAVELSESGKRVEFLEIDPAKLSLPKTGEAAPAATTDLRELTKRARLASAGSIELPLFFTDSAPACTHVTLAIWDGQLRQPLDSLTVPVSVGANGEKGCEEGIHRAHLLSGLDSFIAFGSPAELAAVTTSISLHTFEFKLNDAMRSFVVMAGHEDGKSYVYGWETAKPISESISRSGALPLQIREARKILIASTSTAQQRASAYAKAGKYLHQALFTARSDRAPGKEAAAGAFDTLKRIVARDKEPLTLLARFTIYGANGLDIFYSPLRLLAAAGADVLSRDISVIQPLPIRRRSNATCIDRWTIIGSPKLISAEASPKAKAALDAMLGSESRAWVGETISDSPRLVSFFAGKDPESPAATPVSEGRADGVLLIAHHSDDRGFFFDDAGEAVLPEAATRMFRPGSAVVLAACATANAGSADGFLKLLNRNQVDGVVASPFLVDASYATLMSHEIFKELDHAYANGNTPTLAEILQIAMDRTPRPSDAEPADVSMQLQGLEYVMAGDPDLRLCRLQPQQQAAVTP